MSGKIIWLTGLPASGKTTLADDLHKKLECSIKLDGNDIRDIFTHVGFSEKERNLHVENIGKLSNLIAKNGVNVICAMISPFEESRRIVKYSSSVPFYLIYVKCSVGECIKRDPRGLYKKAINGEIENFTGISQEYQIPKEPDIIVDTENNTIEECIKQILGAIKND